MRKLIILILTLIICFGIFCLLAKLFFPNKGTVITPIRTISEISVDETKTASGKVSKIIVSDGSNAITPDVTITEGSVANVTARLYGKTVSDYRFEFDLSGGVLTIRTSSEHPHTGSKSGNLKLDITVPSGTKLGAIDAQTISGDLRIGCPCSELTASTVSGDLYITSFEGKSLRLESVSGDVSVGAVNTDNAKFHSISGEISVGKAAGGTFSFESVSGEIEIDGFRAEGAQIETISGDVEIKALSDYSLDINTTSGDIKVGNTEAKRKYSSPGKNGTVSVKTTSGDVGVTWFIY